MEGFELFAHYLKAKADQGSWSGIRRWENLTDGDRRAWDQMARGVHPIPLKDSEALREAEEHPGADDINDSQV
jgi:hypothetical protein